MIAISLPLPSFHLKFSPSIFKNASPSGILMPKWCTKTPLVIPVWGISSTEGRPRLCCADEVVVNTMGCIVQNKFDCIVLNLIITRLNLPGHIIDTNIIGTCSRKLAAILCKVGNLILHKSITIRNRMNILKR